MKVWGVKVKLITCNKWEWVWNWIKDLSKFNNIFSVGFVGLNMTLIRRDIIKEIDFFTDGRYKGNGDKKTRFLSNGHWLSIRYDTKTGLFTFHDCKNLGPIIIGNMSDFLSWLNQYKSDKVLCFPVYKLPRR